MAGQRGSWRRARNRKQTARDKRSQDHSRWLLFPPTVDHSYQRAPTTKTDAGTPGAASYRLRVKSFQAPTGVTGADSWSYDATNKVVVVDKQGTTFSIVIAGLEGYP